MKKGIAIPGIIAVLAFAFIILFAGSQLIPGLFLPASIIDIDGLSCQVKGLALTPRFGYYKCAVVGDASPTANINDKSLGNWDTWADCSANTKECEIYIRDKHSPTSILSTRVIWQRCTIGYDCGSENTLDIGFGQEVKIATINKGETLYITGTLGILERGSDYIHVYRKYEQYGLVQSEKGLPETTIDSVSCNLPIFNREDLCIECPGQVSNPKSKLEPDETSAYFDDWLLSPTEAQLVKDGIISVFCNERKLYSIASVKLRSGCYAYPGSLIRNVNCCPGERFEGTPPQYCNENFEWQSEDVGCCIAGFGSDLECSGRGGWIYSAPNEIKQGRCINCNCIYNYQTVECSTNADCTTGFCDVNTWTCQGGRIPCGDRDNDCFDDCTYEKLEGCDATCLTLGQSCNILQTCCPGLNCIDGTCADEGLQFNWINILIGAFAVSAIILFLIFIIGFMLPQITPFTMLLLNPIVLLISLAVLMFIIIMFFLGIAQFVASELL